MWNSKTQFAAIDTETTGIDRSDMPFAVSLTDQFGNSIWYEWDMNVKTRKPKVKKQDIKDIKRLTKGKILVFHNQNFDIQKLSLVGCDLDWRNGKSWDTMYMSHVWNSGAHTELNGRLKELSLCYLDYDDEDQFELRTAVSKARALVKKHNLDWMIAPSDDGDDHIARDMWLPRAIVAQAWELIPDNEKYDDPSSHPWYWICSKYGTGDTVRTMMFFLALRQYGFSQWDAGDKRHNILKREQRLCETIYDIQNTGLSIFPQKIKREVAKNKKLVTEQTKQMQDVLGYSEFNPESSYHMSDALFDTLKFPTKFTSETKTSTKKRRLYKTNKNVRGNLEDGGGLVDWMEVQDLSKINRKRQRFFQSLEIYKKANVVVDYLPQYQKKQIKGILYPFLKQNGTGTTRLSSQNPNGQNINELLRTVFGPDDDHIWYCLDYSQLQLRIFAYITGEKSMIEAFEKGYDFHGFVASKIFNMSIEEVNKDKSKRRIGKNVNFGFIFGASPRKIEQTAGITGLWDTVCNLFPSAHSYMESVKSQVRKYGYVETPHGYRLYCNQPHKGVNYIVQGCEGDIVKEGMNNCHEYLKDIDYKTKMMFQVHDELDFVMKKPKTKKQIAYHKLIVEDLVDLMEQPGLDVGMVTPVDVEHTAKNWKEVTKGYYLDV